MEIKSLCKTIFLSGNLIFEIPGVQNFNFFILFLILLVIRIFLGLILSKLKI